MQAGTPTLVTHDPFSHVFLDGQALATELLLIRHGHATPDKLSPDPIDPPLTEIGLLQAESLAERLRDEEFAAVYASPMKRALQTAAPVAGRLGLGVQTHDGLREVAFRFDQARDEEVAAWAQRFNEQLRQAPRRDGGLFRWDDLLFTEASAAFRARVLQAIEEIVAVHSGERVAIVCHAGVINVYLSHVLGIQSDMFFLPLNTSITTVRALDEQRVVHRLNDYAHLLAPQTMHAPAVASA
jgi:broad specificity phosphatase PhoE